MFQVLLLQLLMIISDNGSLGILCCERTFIWFLSTGCCSMTENMVLRKQIYCWMFVLVAETNYSQINSMWVVNVPSYKFRGHANKILRYKINKAKVQLLWSILSKEHLPLFNLCFAGPSVNQEKVSGTKKM